MATADIILADFLEMVTRGDKLKDIAAHYGISISTLCDYIRKPDVEPAYKIALENSATCDVDRAIEEIENLQDNSKWAEIARARELAKVLTWRASKRCPKVYGDRPESNGNAVILNLRIVNEPITGPAAELETSRPAEIAESKYLESK